MNKQKCAIILLQANAMRNTLKNMEGMPVDIRAWAFEKYGKYQTSPKKANDIVAKMRPTQLASVLRACCLQNNYDGCFRPNSYSAYLFYIKDILLAVTCKKWFLEYSKKKPFGGSIIISNFHKGKGKMK